MMETLQVVIKMLSSFSKNVNFVQVSAKQNDSKNSKFSELILKFHPTESEKVSQNLNHISFVTWAVTKAPQIWLVISLARQMISQLNICVHYLSPTGLEIRIFCLFIIEVLLKSSKKLKNLPKIFILNPSKMSAAQLWTALIQSWTALFGAESPLFRDFQVMNISETDLKLIWIRADHRWMSLRRQPGYTIVWKTLRQQIISQKLLNRSPIPLLL